MNKPSDLDFLCNRILANEQWYEQCTKNYTLEWKINGAYARGLREQQGISLRKLAKAMKVSASFLSDLELGRRNWNSTNVERWKKAMSEG